MRVIVHLTPKASHNKVEGWVVDADGNTVLRVKVTAVPEDGKANEALIKLLAKALHVSKSRISLIRGETSRIKLLDIDMEEEEVVKIVKPVLKRVEKFIMNLCHTYPSPVIARSVSDVAMTNGWVVVFLKFTTLRGESQITSVSRKSWFSQLIFQYVDLC